MSTKGFRAGVVSNVGDSLSNMHSTMVSPVAAAAAVADAVGALVGSVSDGAVRDLTHDQLGGLVVSLRRDLARLESVQLAAVGEVEARGSHHNDGALTAAAWLRMLTNTTPGEAAGQVRTARVLRTGVLPNTAAALAEGAICGPHAQVIADGVIDAPAGAVALIEPEAVAAAAEADVRAVANLMRAFGHALDPEGADAAAVRRYERAGITLSPTLDGSMAVSGLADEVTGALIATAVDTAAPMVPGDTRTAARRRLDGLAEIARRYLADPAAPRRGGGGHPHLVVTVDQTTLHAAARSRDNGTGPGGAGPGGTLSWIGRIAGSTAGRVGCDAIATFVTLGPDGEVTEAGTSRRFFTASPTPRHPRPRRRPLQLALVRPAHRLVRRPPPGPRRRRRPHHRRQRRPALRSPPRVPARRRLAAAATTRRPLPRPPPRHRPHPRPRTPPTRPQPTTPRAGMSDAANQGSSTSDHRGPIRRSVAVRVSSAGSLPR